MAIQESAESKIDLSLQISKTSLAIHTFCVILFVSLLDSAIRRICEDL
ncbi:hypothetical protein ACWIUD_10305 [Helicobacter sp. 23-1044]